MGGDDSQSSSEDKEDGLFTATDVIKEEVKKLENRLSDQDLLKKDVKWKRLDRSERSLDEGLISQVYRANSSEPLTESIMKMRSKPGSALIVKQCRKAYPSPLAMRHDDLETLVDVSAFEPVQQESDSVLPLLHNVKEKLFPQVIDAFDKVKLLEESKVEELKSEKGVKTTVFCD